MPLDPNQARTLLDQYLTQADSVTALETQIADAQKNHAAILQQRDETKAKLIQALG